MQTGNNGKQRIQIHVPDMFQQLLLMELGKARGLEIWINGRSSRKVSLSCSKEEADALLREATPAGNVLCLLQLESVAKSMKVAGQTPSQNLLDMVAQLRSELGVLAARV
ncbi:MAG: hypothetical protein JXC85_04475 [Candidatus Aenigmarchaeota archaeon]|nr:hypothetical protein [Candidatus Aenigmarchaeota archaeon]